MMLEDEDSWLREELGIALGTLERRPAVRNGCRRAEAGLILLSGVPMQTFRDKVDEQLIVAAQNLGKRLGPGSSASAFGIYDRSR